MSKNQSRLDPEKSRGKLKPMRHFRSPVEKNRVDQASNRRVTVQIIFYEIRQDFRSVSNEIHGPVVTVFGCGNASVGESKEREIVVVPLAFADLTYE
ncbi:unnamed protein product [Microthlaspi erraticum]|uniref:Uncharacterized protein n=1 Tax=Microthlaspi erraticum TaxID=1685480 RepID=A0A6D2KN19_9BRAS|nr:unnamed protein product [Microthlaspi erraticum]CAA7050422.1 unnamed protein product [Microthlaspi erraticum]